MNPPRISMLRLVAVVAILGLLLLGPPGAMADPVLTTVLGTKLVSDIPGFAPVFDLNLVNPIGIAASAASPDWVANNGSGVATLYDTQGQRQTLVVSLPSPGNPNGGGAPTGAVFNVALANSTFQITDGVHTASALFMRSRTLPDDLGRLVVRSNALDG